jgi:hypothetical protein
MANILRQPCDEGVRSPQSIAAFCRLDNEIPCEGRGVQMLTQQVRVGILVMDLGCYSGPRIELAGDTLTHGRWSARLSE